MGSFEGRRDTQKSVLVGDVGDEGMKRAPVVLGNYHRGPALPGCLTPGLLPAGVSRRQAFSRNVRKRGRRRP
ncbi:MAG: hypothetical protein JWO93_3292 [Micrococcaceae bacterium]|jgi:hypothetical protein|nr:hypothetical protein [Micrococcaceae bacterium]